MKDTGRCRRGAVVAVDAVGPDGRTVVVTALVEAGDGRYEAAGAGLLQHRRRSS